MRGRPSTGPVSVTGFVRGVPPAGRNPFGDTLPLKPGVYIMQDAKNEVIYVGKAKALKNRVSQYFANLASHTEKTRAMVSQIDHFDVIVADSEFEALILENSLIKRHQPHYNILLKDDKGYPYIRLTVKEPYPRFSLANRAAEDGARYFGPTAAGEHPEHHRRPARRPEAALVQPEVPTGHRKGAALPELPHGPV